MVVATGADGSVTLYDLASGEQIGDRMSIPVSEPRRTAIRPDGLETVEGGGSGTDMLAWDLDPQDWIKAACKLAGRDLTPEEWDTYLGDLASYHQTCPAARA